MDATKQRGFQSSWTGAHEMTIPRAITCRVETESRTRIRTRRSSDPKGVWLRSAIFHPLKNQPRGPLAAIARPPEVDSALVDKIVGCRSLRTDEKPGRMNRPERRVGHVALRMESRWVMAAESRDISGANISTYIERRAVLAPWRTTVEGDGRHRPAADLHKIWRQIRAPFIGLSMSPSMVGGIASVATSTRRRSPGIGTSKRPRRNTEPAKVS